MDPTQSPREVIRIVQQAIADARNQVGGANRPLPRGRFGVKKVAQGRPGVVAPYTNKAAYDRAKRRVERFLASGRKAEDAPTHIKFKGAMRLDG